MTASMRNHIIGVGVLMIISIHGSSQQGLWSTSEKYEPPAEQQTEVAENSAIVVDRNIKSKSFPSMEEEMAMYMALRAKEPKAFFFPNPSKGVIWIEHNLGKETNLSILDSKGKVVFTAEKLKAQKIDLSTFKSGSYILVLNNRKDEVSKDLVVR